MCAEWFSRSWFNAHPERYQIRTGTKISQIYRRLHPDRPAHTITAAGGGGTQGFHWEEDRALTNRERARLQTFPDDFEFVGNYASVRKQIGMAMPPLMAMRVFAAIKKGFDHAGVIPQSHA